MSQMIHASGFRAQSFWTWQTSQNHREEYKHFPDSGKKMFGKNDLDSILELLMLMHGWHEVSVSILSGS